MTVNKIICTNQAQHLVFLLLINKLTKDSTGVD